MELVCLSTLAAKHDGVCHFRHGVILLAALVIINRCDVVCDNQRPICACCLKEMYFVVVYVGYSQLRCNLWISALRCWVRLILSCLGEVWFIANSGI